MDTASPSVGAFSDPRALLLNAPMSAFQWLAVATTVALCALDGFDVFAITFAAPALLTDWGINKAEVGIALSAGLVGMALGSLLLSPLADLFGRRRMIFVALAVMIVGTTWTALIGNLVGLVASRLFTGLGIGTMISVILPLAAEYANAVRRDLAVSLLAIGFPVGGILGGFISAILLASFGWRSIFWAASAFAVLMLLVSAFALLEPAALVIARPGRDGLTRVNAFLKRCGHGGVDTLPPPPPSQKSPIRRLFGAGMARTTIRITLIYFMIVIPVFFMQTWLPTLVFDRGIVPAKAALVSAFFNVGGVVAGLVVGFTSLKLGLRTILNTALIGGMVMIVAFSRLPANLPLLVAASIVSGFFIQGLMVSLYAVIARTFPADMRASGSGFVVGVGRIGSILPPLFAGALAAEGFGRTSIAAIMAIPGIVAFGLLVDFVIHQPTTA